MQKHILPSTIELKQNKKSKNVGWWGMKDDKGRPLHKYVRHGVKKDLLSFCGWKELTDLFQRLRWRNETFADVAVVSFKLASRINEALPLDNTITQFEINDDYIVVYNYLMLKRYKKVPNEFGDNIFDFICKRCKHVNNMYSSNCEKCNTNLVMHGKKRYLTVRRLDSREPFFIPRDEPFDSEFVRIISQRKNNYNQLVPFKGLLFPSQDPRTYGKPYTSEWAYYHITHCKLPEGSFDWWNHRFRGERLLYFREQGFLKDELKNFSGITNDRTLEFYTKGILTYANKLGMNIDAKILREAKEKQRIIQKQTEHLLAGKLVL